MTLRVTIIECLWVYKKRNKIYLFLFVLSFNQFLPSIILVTNILDAESPTTFNIVAGGSIIVAIIVSIPSEAIGKPNIVIINVSEIVPSNNVDFNTFEVKEKEEKKEIKDESDYDDFFDDFFDE